MSLLPIVANYHSKSGNIYELSIKENNNGSFKLLCSCPAGEYTKLCRHKKELITGDFKNFENIESIEKFREENIERFSEIIKLYFDIEDMNKEIDKIKRKQKKVSENVRELILGF